MAVTKSSDGQSELGYFAELVCARCAAVLFWLSGMTWLSAMSRKVAARFIERLGGDGDWSASQLLVMAFAFVAMAVIVKLRTDPDV